MATPFPLDIINELERLTIELERAAHFADEYGGDNSPLSVLVAAALAHTALSRLAIASARGQTPETIAPRYDPDHADPSTADPASPTLSPERDPRR